MQAVYGLKKVQCKEKVAKTTRGGGIRINTENAIKTHGISCFSKENIPLQHKLVYIFTPLCKLIWCENLNRYTINPKGYSIEVDEF